MSAKAFPGGPDRNKSEGHRLPLEPNSAHATSLDICVHELFEQQVARNPEALAATCRRQRLSYRELNERANQVAHYLCKRGIGSESLVGVCLERSLEMVIALLGVWKAGAAYVPLDPAYPADRLSFMISDSGMKVLLTDRKCNPLFHSDACRAIYLDSEWPVIAQKRSDNLGVATPPSSLAYVMYTSGSTGQPKGVMIEHKSLVNYLCWAIKTYEVGGNGSIPIHSSIAFDSTVASLYPPLLCGGQIELLPDDLGAQNLVAALRETKDRGKVVITPAHLELLSQQFSPAEMAGLTKVLVIAGEALLAEQLSKWRDLAPEMRLFNEYGPTETTVGCCAYEVRAEDSRNGPVPIGSPISNVQLYVLDESLRPVPPGRIGELYIGGAGVARGYLGKPELTRERFLADPFSGRSDARMYKSGDMVRQLENGKLEFLGRADDQVKIRGCRIELGEIEATLVAHPGVRSCSVLARESVPGSKQLVAFVMPQKGESVQAGDLKKFLEQRLPDYMVPVYFIFLDSFPLTQNGKVDRKSLSALPYEDSSAGHKILAPRTDTEEIIAAIWRDKLKRERIGVHDDFFKLGGDSLLAMMVLSEIREMFGITLSMRTFFSGPTIAGLAKAMEDSKRYGDGLDDAAGTRKKGNESPFFWIVADASVNFLSDHLGPAFSGISFEPGFLDHLTAPYRMEEIAKDFLLALRRQQAQGPYRLGGFCLGGVVAYEVARQLTLLGQEVELLVLIEPFNHYQSARAKFAAEWRRMLIRLGFHSRALWSLGIREIPAYASDRWRTLLSSFRDLALRFSPRFGSPETRELRPPDLEKILFLAGIAYNPKPLEIPTIIFRCQDYPIQSAGDPHFGWRELLLGRTETHEVPGDHLGLFQEPHVQVLAEKLGNCLQAATQARAAERDLNVAGVEIES